MNDFQTLYAQAVALDLALNAHPDNSAKMHRCRQLSDLLAMNLAALCGTE